MSANDIPADDWRVITAGVRDPDELARLRFAYTTGAYRGKWLALDAIGQITMPDAAPIAVLVPEAAGGSLICARCFCRAAILVEGECTLCRAGKPPEAEVEEVG